MTDLARDGCARCGCKRESHFGICQDCACRGFIPIEPQPPTDTERLDWLEKNGGTTGRYVNDGAGQWAFFFTQSSGSVTNIEQEVKRWKPTIREAIDHAIKEEPPA
jgi:hypothetical protein